MSCTRAGSPMTSFRGFIAIDIGATPPIIELMNALAASGADMKLVEPHNIHITLKFLGDTDERLVDEIDTIMEEAASTIKPSSVLLKGAGVFPSKNYIRVVWIGMQETEPLSALAHALDEHIVQLGFKKEKRPFSPHLTLGRVRTSRNKECLLEVLQQYETMAFGKQAISSIKLKKSELTPKGPVYTTLREVTL